MKERRRRETKIFVLSMKQYLCIQDEFCFNPLLHKFAERYLIKSPN